MTRDIQEMVRHLRDSDDDWHADFNRLDSEFDGWIRGVHTAFGFLAAGVCVVLIFGVFGPAVWSAMQ